MSLWEFQAVRNGWKKAHIPEDAEQTAAPSIETFRAIMGSK